MGELANLVVLVLFVAAVVGWVSGLGRWIDRRVRGAGRPRVTIRSYGNTSDEDDVRWFHAEVFCETDVVASEPRVTVLLREGNIGHERWRFAESCEWIGRSPVFIPLVVGNLSDNPTTARGPKWRLDTGAWYLTPDAEDLLGRKVAGHGDRGTYHFEVRVSWVENERQAHAEETFRLTLSDRGPVFGQAR